MASQQKRSVPLKVSLTPELHERLKEVSAALGLATATVASIAIGQYVAAQHRALGAADKAMQGMVAGLVEEVAPQMKLLMEAEQAKPAPAPRKGGKR